MDGRTLSDEELDRIVALRRMIHRRPELAFDEHHTAELVESELEDIGLTSSRLAGTGVVACLDGIGPGRTVMLRADLDALPIQELNEHSYRSKNEGCMHACGHDGHTAILLGVARALHRRRETLTGRVLFVFQPAEEGAGGAQAMIDAGLLERWRPDSCAGLHLWSEAPTGAVLVTSGPFMASMDRFDITIQGAGGHGAVPQSTRDPIVAAAQLVVALQTVVSRSIDPLEAAVLTVGTLHGGEAFNVIPDRVSLSGTVRTFNKQIQDKIEEVFRRVVRSTVDALGCTAEVTYHRISIPVVNDSAHCEVARSLARDIPGATLGPATFRTMGGEDMALFLDHVPGVYFFVGAGNDAVGASYPHHHPRFQIDEAALPIGATLLIRLAEQLTRQAPS